MCGISGYIAREGNLLPNSVISDMTELISHRGPDGEGFLFLTQDHSLVTAGGECTTEEVWRTQTEYSPQQHIKSIRGGLSKMTFGHKRLSILDLTACGHQPMSYGDGRYWIVYNGEIYNFQEINRELIQVGYQFKTRSDTETILAAYSEWGEACLERFVGMFAFAIFDKEKNEIFFARDRYGIKPFYYYFSPEGDFYFGSEIKQFTVLKGWQSRLNPQRVYDHLVYSFTDHTEETMFSGVYQLPGGSSYKASINGIKADRTGKILFKKWYILKSDPFKGSFSEAATIFKSLFKRSVEEHLHADVPVGTALSGGLDSSSIVCQVNSILKAAGIYDTQKTFSSCSSYEKFNEKKWMDIVIDFTKVEAHFIYPKLEDALEQTNDIIWYHDEPYQSQSAFLGYNVFGLAKSKGVRVLLNGQGPDEYLGGYGQFAVARYAKMVKQLKIAALLSDIRKLQKINYSSNSSIYKEIAAHLLPYSLKRGLSSIKSSSDNAKSIVDIRKLNLKPVHPFDIIPSGSSSVPEISKHLTFFSTLPKFLHWEDRNSMAHSMEARVPFLDHRLVEFAYNLQDDFLEKDGITKRVMREAMTDILPEKIKNRTDKMGFTTPEEYWVKKENPTYFRAKISEAISISDGIIKPEALKYFDKILSGKIPFDYTYWRIILFSQWMQKFHVNK